MIDKDSQNLQDPVKVMDPNWNGCCLKLIVAQVSIQIMCVEDTSYVNIQIHTKLNRMQVKNIDHLEKEFKCRSIDEM